MKKCWSPGDEVGARLGQPFQAPDDVSDIGHVMQRADQENEIGDADRQVLALDVRMHERRLRQIMGQRPRGLDHGLGLVDPDIAVEISREVQRLAPRAAADIDHGADA